MADVEHIERQGVDDRGKRNIRLSKKLSTDGRASLRSQLFDQTG